MASLILLLLARRMFFSVLARRLFAGNRQRSPGGMAGLCFMFSLPFFFWTLILELSILLDNWKASPFVIFMPLLYGGLFKNRSIALRMASYEERLYN